MLMRLRASSILLFSCIVIVWVAFRTCSTAQDWWRPERAFLTGYLKVAASHSAALVHHADVAESIRFAGFSAQLPCATRGQRCWGVCGLAVSGSCGSGASLAQQSMRQRKLMLIGTG